MSDLRTDMKTLMATDPNVVMQDDIRLLLETLGLHTGARNASPHEVMVDEIIPVVRNLVRAAAQVDLRDQFAMAALTGLLAGRGEETGVANGWASSAYAIADAMWEAR